MSPSYYDKNALLHNICKIVLLSGLGSSSGAKLELDALSRSHMWNETEIKLK